jgi:hypothetical protein
MKPNQVWIKQDNVDWRCIFSSHSPMEARDYAMHNVAHGNNVERIELRDLTGSLGAVYDRSWK